MLIKVLIIIVCSCSINYSFAKTFSLKEVESFTSKLSSNKNIQHNKIIAKSVYKINHKYKHDPRLILAILKVESDLNQNAISKTEDYSIAQINYKIWNNEFKRMNMKPINFKKLKKDIPYSIETMGLILSILKDRHKEEDLYWFTRYHSGTHKYKTAYLKKIKIQLAKFNKDKKYAKNKY